MVCIKTKKGKDFKLYIAEKQFFIRKSYNRLLIYINVRIHHYFGARDKQNP